MSLGQFSFTQQNTHHYTKTICSKSTHKPKFISLSLSCKYILVNSWTRRISFVFVCVTLTLLSAFYWASPIQNHIAVWLELLLSLSLFSHIVPSPSFICPFLFDGTMRYAKDLSWFTSYFVLAHVCVPSVLLSLS